MATKIERLEESLRKAREKQDISKLDNVSNRIEGAYTVLKSHVFRSRRVEKIAGLGGLFLEVRKAISEARLIKADSPAEVK